MQDEVKLSIKYMEPVNHSSNLPPKNPLKIILKRKTGKYKENMGRGTATEEEFSVDF